MRVPSTMTHVMSKILLYLYPDPIFETTTISLDLSDSKYVWSAKDTPLFLVRHNKSQCSAFFLQLSMKIDTSDAPH